MLDPIVFVNQEGIDAEKFIITTYLMTMPTENIIEVSQAIAYKQSSGTWTHVPEGTPDVRELAMAQINGRVPILAHPYFAGAMFDSPHCGVSSSLILGKFMRIAGADFVVCPSPYGKAPRCLRRCYSWP